MGWGQYLYPCVYSQVRTRQNETKMNESKVRKHDCACLVPLPLALFLPFPTLAAFPFGRDEPINPFTPGFSAPWAESDSLG